MISTDRPMGPDETRLCAEQFFWIAPRRSARRADPIRARLPRKRPLCLGAGSQRRRILDGLVARLRLRPVSTIDLPSVSLMLSYVRQGLGIGPVPGLALQRDDRRQLTVEPADTPSTDVRLACRATLKRTKPVGRGSRGPTVDAPQTVVDSFPTIGIGWK